MNEYMYILTKTMMDGRVIPVCVTPFKDVAIYKAFDDGLEHEWIESNEDAIYCLDSYTYSNNFLLDNNRKHIILKVFINRKKYLIFQI